MPDRGLLEANAVPLGEFAATEPLVLPEARWAQITFEVARSAALAALPGEAGRPVPPYARLLVAEAGQLSLAVLSVGGRFRMLPRNVVVSALSNDVERIQPYFAAAAQPGHVSLTREGLEARAEVAVGSQPLARLELPGLYAIEPSMLRWDVFLAAARAADHLTLAELTPAPEIRDAFLTHNGRLEIAKDLDRTHQWRRLASLVVISACYAEGSLTLSAPVVQEG
jgi:hypothetical protein